MDGEGRATSGTQADDPMDGEDRAAFLLTVLRNEH